MTPFHSGAAPPDVVGNLWLPMRKCGRPSKDDKLTPFPLAAVPQAAAAAAARRARRRSTRVTAGGRSCCAARRAPAGMTQRGGPRACAPGGRRATAAGRGGLLWMARRQAAMPTLNAGATHCSMHVLGIPSVPIQHRSRGKGFARARQRTGAQRVKPPTQRVKPEPRAACRATHCSFPHAPPPTPPRSSLTFPTGAQPSSAPSARGMQAGARARHSGAAPDRRPSPTRGPHPVPLALPLTVPSMGRPRGLDAARGRRPRHTGPAGAAGRPAARAPRPRRRAGRRRPASPVRPPPRALSRSLPLARPAATSACGVKAQLARRLPARACVPQSWAGPSLARLCWRLRLPDRDPGSRSLGAPRAVLNRAAQADAGRGRAAGGRS